MFPPNTPMTLTAVTFGTETVDEETRRVVLMTFTLAPFTAPLAEELAVRSLLFTHADAKDAIDTMIVRVDAPVHRMTFAMAPDQTERRIVLDAVALGPKLRVRVKRDRDPAEVSAVIKFSVRYPDADTLLYLANGVQDTHYVTLEPEQGDLLTSVAEDAPPRVRSRRGGALIGTGDELRPGVHAEH